MKIKKIVIMFIVISFTVIGFTFILNNSNSVKVIRNTTTSVKNNDSIEVKRDIQKIINSVNFQKKIHAQAEKIYYEHVRINAETQLIKLQDSGFVGNKVSMVTNFLKKRNPKLVIDAGAIARLPRWAEVLAIIGAETSFCKNGVGINLNNCGAIKNTSGHFKSYTTKFSSIKDLANLLQRKNYKNLSIQEMNGLYCVDAKTKGMCSGWSERVLMFVDQIFSS